MALLPVPVSVGWAWTRTWLDVALMSPLLPLKNAVAVEPAGRLRLAMVNADVEPATGAAVQPAWMTAWPLARVTAPILSLEDRAEPAPGLAMKLSVPPLNVHGAALAMRPKVVVPLSVRLTEAV